MPLIDRFLLLYMATVVKVHDGDTLTIEKDDADKSQVVVRLNRIDAPELKQPYGIESRNYLIDLVLTKEVRVDPIAKDMYGREVADIFSEINVNRKMVTAGMAWRYIKYDKEKYSDLAVSEQDARDAHIGLWQDANPKAPWIYRKEQKHIHRKMQKQGFLLDETR